MRAVRVAAVTLMAVALLSVSLSVVSAHDDRGDNHGDHQGELTWMAKLRGTFETPPRDTPARGVALFSLEDGKVNYVILVARISNVIMAHIHCGAPGVAGPVGVTLLMMRAPGGGPVHGVLVRSSFTAPDTGNKCGWTTLADVVAAVVAGNAYVNVHTSDGVHPANSGPGNFPGGEIRGQLRALDDD